MSILAECPMCRRKQAVKNKLCKCGSDLDQAKRSRKVRYWIDYRLPNGKQRRELSGNLISEARDAEIKLRVQRRENRIPDRKITFDDLSVWYLDLETVKYL